MIVVPPVYPITSTNPFGVAPAMLTDTDIPEPDTGESAYNAGTTYAVGDEVIRTSTHRRYRSLQASNTGHTPESSPTWWEDVGPTNRYAMFDLLRSKQSMQADSITVEITPGERIDALALFGLVATEVSITLTVSGSPVYTATVDLDDRNTLTWSDYFFAGFRWKPVTAVFDLPPYTGGVLEVTITNTGATAKCGALLIGRQVYMGSAEFQAAADVRNFSTVDRTEEGNAVVTQRRSVPVTTQRVWTEKGRVNTLRQVRDDLNASPAAWSTLDDEIEDGYFESLLMLGFHRRFRIGVDHPTHALVDIELEGI